METTEVKGREEIDGEKVKRKAVKGDKKQSRMTEIEEKKEGKGKEN